MSNECTMPMSIPANEPSFILMPVYASNRGNQVGLVAVSSRHQTSLVALELTYWFVGDRRGEFPVLKRTLSALNQHGWAVNIAIPLHRLIALSAYGAKIPSDIQEVTQRLVTLGPIAVTENSCRNLADRSAVARQYGFDFRDEHIVDSSRHPKRRKQKPVVFQSSAQSLLLPEGVSMPQVTPSTDLHDLAIEMLSADERASLRPGDTAEDVAARRANRLAEPQSISDILRIASTTSREEVSRLTGKPLPSDAEIFRAMTDAGLSADELPKKLK